MNLQGGGSVGLRAPEHGEWWAADLSVLAAEGVRPSAAVYLSDEECIRLAEWLVAMTDRSNRDERRPRAGEAVTPDKERDQSGV